MKLKTEKGKPVKLDLPLKSPQAGEAESSFRKVVMDIAQRHHEILEEFIRAHLSAELILSTREFVETYWGSLPQEIKEQRYYERLAVIVKQLELVRDERNMPVQVSWRLRVRKEIE